MTPLVVGALYVIGMFVGARCAAHFIRRIDNHYDLPHQDWDGTDWFLVLYTALCWPVAVPIGHFMTWDRPAPSFLWLQRLLGGPS